MNISLVSSLLSISIGIGFSQILNDDRKIDWQAGILGGIPTERVIDINLVSDYNTSKDSSSDASVDLQDAINSLTNGGVILIPEGKYRLDNQIELKHDNIIIVGEGASKTKLYSNYAGSSFFIGTYQRGDWQNLISGYSKGSKEITVQDGSQFTIGEFAEIQQDNDSTLMYTDEAWKLSWAEGSVGQLFEVSEINGNIISFTTPLHFDIRNDLNPIIRPQNFRKSCGIENLYIEKTNANNHTFEFKNAAYNWLRQVESFNTRRSHVNVNTGLANEFRENYIHHSHYYGGGGSGYGIELNFHASDNLIEDNIFTHLRHAMMVHVGAVGNEFNYNFSNDPVQGENGDEGPLNDVWSPPDISLHGHWAQYNLFEGNVVKEIGIGDHWGPMGPGNTFLRNVVSGEGIYEKDANLNQNIIGNWSSSYSSDLTSINTIYHLNVIDGTQQKSSEISEDQAPSSYSYLSKPWFWSAELSWPVSPVSQTDSLVIPASIRFANGDFFKIDTNNIVSNSVQITQKQLPNFSITNIDNYTYFEVDQNSEIQFIQIFNTNGKKVTQVHCSKKSICRVDLKEHRGIKIIRLKIDDTLQHHLTK